MVRLTRLYKIVENAFHESRIIADTKTIEHFTRFLIAQGVTVCRDYPEQENDRLIMERIVKNALNSRYGKFGELVGYIDTDSATQD